MLCFGEMMKNLVWMKLRMFGITGKGAEWY